LNLLRIYIDHKEPDDAFFLFSCHCRTDRLLMHSTEGVYEDDYVNSTDPAMVTFNVVTFNSTNGTQPYVFVTNPWSRPVAVLALARRYSATDPVPGWCTTWDWVRPKPFLSIAWDSAIIRLNFSRASLLHDDLKCNEKGKFEYEIYHRYLQESTDRKDMDKDFADSIKSFHEIDDIMRTGTLVSSLGNWPDRLIFASYPPIGSLYAVIVHYQNANSTGAALYGLGHTYGCRLDPDTGVCFDDGHVITKIVCGLAVFVGLVMAFAGHRFFITSQFLFGFYAGSFAGFIFINLSASWSFSVNFSLTMVCGVAGAALTTLLWLVLGIPVLSIFLPTIELGVLAASILMFTPPLNVASLTVDLYYWLVFLCLVLALPGILLAFTQKASLLSCVVIGTYTTVIPIDYFLGTNLRYISINVLRRATVPEFSEAVILPPLQVRATAMGGAWWWRMDGDGGGEGEGGGVGRVHSVADVAMPDVGPGAAGVLAGPGPRGPGDAAAGGEGEGALPALAPPPAALAAGARPHGRGRRDGAAGGGRGDDGRLRGGGGRPGGRLHPRLQLGGHRDTGGGPRLGGPRRQGGEAGRGGAGGEAGPREGHLQAAFPRGGRTAALQPRDPLICL
jgi:hypothetical protein